MIDEENSTHDNNNNTIYEELVNVQAKFNKSKLPLWIQKGEKRYFRGHYILNIPILPYHNLKYNLAGLARQLQMIFINTYKIMKKK